MLARISKTKPWLAPGLRSIFLAMLLRLPRWGPGAIATGILARCQEYTKRMPSGCQGNAKGIPSARHEGCHEDAMLGILHQCRREYSGIPSPLRPVGRGCINCRLRIHIRASQLRALKTYAFSGAVRRRAGRSAAGEACGRCRLAAAAGPSGCAPDRLRGACIRQATGAAVK